MCMVHGAFAVVLLSAVLVVFGGAGVPLGMHVQAAVTRCVADSWCAWVGAALNHADSRSPQVVQMTQPSCCAPCTEH